MIKAKSILSLLESQTDKFFSLREFQKVLVEISGILGSPKEIENQDRSINYVWGIGSITRIDRLGGKNRDITGYSDMKCIMKPANFFDLIGDKVSISSKVDSKVLFSSINNSLKSLGLKVKSQLKSSSDSIYFDTFKYPELARLVTPKKGFEMTFHASMTGNQRSLFAGDGDTGIVFDIYPQQVLVYFVEISSLVPGTGSKMVDAVMKFIPKGWNVKIHRDWSQGFWPKMASKYSSYQWNLI